MGFHGFKKDVFVSGIRLDGHEYGGQCVKVSSISGLLYTASMDYSLKSWSLEDKCLRDSTTDHCDYVQSIVVHAL